ncbi:hypothetical protein K0M31_016884 [Melipona bicolor]|uniref:Uncharacterized protein n=1 Tax=Melipona bicolor TaxID=60889 RepID=A0AA40FE66_9HYME|nr:hypothetical protein K0M31_016884 [Melipona bicolor]
MRRKPPLKICVETNGYEWKCDSFENFKYESRNLTRSVRREFIRKLSSPLVKRKSPNASNLVTRVLIGWRKNLARRSTLPRTKLDYDEHLNTPNK